MNIIKKTSLASGGTTEKRISINNQLIKVDTNQLEDSNAEGKNR